MQLQTSKVDLFASHEGGAIRLIREDSPEPGAGLHLELEYEGDIWRIHLDGEEESRFVATVNAMKKERPHARFTADDGTCLRIGFDNRGDPYREGLRFDIDREDEFGPAIFIEMFEVERMRIALSGRSRRMTGAAPDDGPAPG